MNRHIINLLKIVKEKAITITEWLWQLNWETIIGILFLIPPILGTILFILNILFDAYLGFDNFPQEWNCIYGHDSDSFSDQEIWGEGAYGYGYGWAYGYAATPAIPLYLGLMAIAGAYLIKGNLKKK